MKLIDDLIHGKDGICDSLQFCCVSLTTQITKVIQSRFPSANVSSNFNEDKESGNAVMDVVIEYDDFTIALRFDLQKRKCGYYIKNINQV